MEAVVAAGTLSDVIVKHAMKRTDWSWKKMWKPSVL